MTSTARQYGGGGGGAAYQRGASSQQQQQQQQQQSKQPPLLSYLEACVSHMQTSCETLEDTTTYLSRSTADLARLRVVLASRRHFDLVGERQVRAARDRLVAEITPLLKDIIVRAEKGVEAKERRSRALAEKLAAQNARLASLGLSVPGGSPAVAAPSASGSGTVSAPAPPRVTAEMVASKRAELERVRSSKDRLLKDLEALEADVERERAEAEMLARSAANAVARDARRKEEETAASRRRVASARTSGS